MSIRQTRSEFEEEILQLLSKRFGRTEAVKLAKEYSAKIYASYSVRAAPSIVVNEIAKYEAPSASSSELGRKIAHQSSGSEKHLLSALDEAGVRILRAYPAPSFGLATDERRNLLQIHVRFPDGLMGFFAPGGPPRLWSYRFIVGTKPGDATLAGVEPKNIAKVTTSLWDE
jgi:chorismate mutase